MSIPAIDMIAILGPTATGKTKFAAALAATLDGEVISADSRQVYKEMNIGTGKDYGDYAVAGRRVPCHLIDLVEPGSEYNVYTFQKDFVRAYNGIRTRGKTPVLCGGTGMYLEAVLNGYELNYGEMFQKLNTWIHQFAKRQETWFGRMERNGIEINWIDGNLSAKEKVEVALEILKTRSGG